MMDHMEWWDADGGGASVQPGIAAQQQHMSSPVIGGGPIMVTIPKSPCDMRLSGSPLGCGTPSPGSTPSPSPKSPSSWQESFQELSRSLQQICGSPTKELGGPLLKRGNSYAGRASSGPASPTPSGAVSAGPYLLPVSPFAQQLQQQQLQQQQQQLQAQQVTDSTKQATAAAAAAAATTPPPTADAADLKGVLVRHEESERTLKKKLAAIWQGSHSSGEDSDSPDSDPASTKVRNKQASRRESVCNSFRVHAGLLDHPLDCISVGVDKRVLRIASWRNRDDPTTLLEARIPPNVDMERLDCYVQENTVFVKERSRKRLHIGELPQHRDTFVIYLPILWEDSNSGLLKIIQHVPRALRGFQIQVKTLDERLMVSTRVTPEVIQEQHHPAASILLGGCFSRVMQLPERVHPRSVSAALSPSNQLIIRGNLEPRHLVQHTC